MFIPLILAISLVVALARGGHISNLLALQPRHIWLLFIPLILQIIAFSPLGDSTRFGADFPRALHLASLALAAIALALNRHLPGLSLIALGLALNFIVIALNGGFMPVSATARQFAGMSPLTGRYNNVIPMNDKTILPWLGDILPLPAWMPFANVFSLGDVLITLGGLIFIQRGLVRNQAPSNAPSQN